MLSFLKSARIHMILKPQRHNFFMADDSETDRSQRIRLRWYFDGNRAGPVLAKRTHVDDESVLHVLAQHAFVGSVDLLDRNDFDLGGDVVLAAGVKHLLGLGHAANHGSRAGGASVAEAGQI